MTAERIRTFRINQYLVDPSKNLISGPSSVSEIAPVLMSILVQFAHSPKKYISTQQLLPDPGLNAQSGSPYDLNAVIQELLKYLGDDPEHPKLIVGSIDDGYKLCTEVVFVYTNPTGTTTALPVELNTGPDSSVHKPSKSTKERTSSAQRQGELTPPISETGWIESLKQRRVFRAMGAYVVSSWLIMQIMSLLVEAFPAIPPSATGYVTIALAIGFPFAILLAWLVQLTPPGLHWDINTEGRKSWFKEHLVHLIDVFVIVVRWS